MANLSIKILGDYTIDETYLPSGVDTFVKVYAKSTAIGINDYSLLYDGESSEMESGGTYYFIDYIENTPYSLQTLKMFS